MGVQSTRRILGVVDHNATRKIKNKVFREASGLSIGTGYRPDRLL